MKIYFMKQNALDYLKYNINELYQNYYKYDTNEWLYDALGYEPFEFFMEIPTFSLAEITEKKGVLELENCKRIFEAFKNLSPSQASDERLWAGLCHSNEFYNYVRSRWDYPTMKYKKPSDDAGKILSRFFFKGSRSGMYRNTLSKCWWVGYLTYDETNKNWDRLDAIGSEDFSSKVSDIFYSNTFSASDEILTGICMALNVYRKRGISLQVRNHIRPMLQYLNAIGGATVLDFYSKDEIAIIVTEFIENIRNNSMGSSIIFNENEEDDDQEDEFFDEGVNIDYFEQLEEYEELVEEFDPNSVGLKADKVTYGCLVYVDKLPANITTRFYIPFNEDGVELTKLQGYFIGKEIGDIIKFGINSYIIKSIGFYEL